MGTKEKIKKLIKRFKKVKEEKDWKKLESELTQRRLRWFRKNKKYLSLKGDDLEKAYQLILLKIGVRKSEAPIVKNKKSAYFSFKKFMPSLRGL
jgi:hypothetical protein